MVPPRVLKGPGQMVPPLGGPDCELNMKSIDFWSNRGSSDNLYPENEVPTTLKDTFMSELEPLPKKILATALRCS